MRRVVVLILMAAVLLGAYCSAQRTPQLEGIPSGDIQKAIHTGEYD